MSGSWRIFTWDRRGDAYVAATHDEHDDNVLVRMRPERWLTADFSKAGY